MVFTNEDIKEATGISQSRLHRAQQRGVLKPQKPGRRGQGGGPEWSVANLGAAFGYEEFTSMGFMPERLKPLLRIYEAMEGWEANPQRLSTGKLSFDPSDFPKYLLFNGTDAVESESLLPRYGRDGAAVFRLGRLYIIGQVAQSIGSIALFAGAREVPEAERFTEFMRIAEDHESYGKAALGLLSDASRELVADKGVQCEQCRWTYYITLQWDGEHWTRRRLHEDYLTCGNCGHANRGELATDDPDQPVDFPDLRVESRGGGSGRLLSFLGITPGSAEASDICREIKTQDGEYYLADLHELAAEDVGTSSMGRTKPEED